MNITPIANYLQVRKINQQKYTTRNINFGMAKLDQVQLLKSKDDYYRQAREGYIGHFWTFHPEDEQYIPKLGSAQADEKYFIDNCPAQEMKEVLSAKKYGINKDQNFYQAVNLDGYYNLAAEDRHLILDEIYRLPVLKEGEQRKTVLSELAAADIKEFWKFLSYGFANYTPQAREKVLKADTYLWDTLDDKNKRCILYQITEATELKLVTQEMKKLPEAKPNKNQSSILTAYAEADNIGRREFGSLISKVDKETLLNWMKKDNVFVKKISIYDVINLVKLVGIEEFDNIYSKKYGRLFDTFFDNPRDKERAISYFGVGNYKEQYEQEYGNWERIKYDSYLYEAKNKKNGVEVLPELKSRRFKELEAQYQADFIIKILNGKIKPYIYDLMSTFNDIELQNLVEDYALNNENISIEDSIKILEGLLKIYTETVEYYQPKSIYDKARQAKVNRYQGKIINIQIALQTLKAQIQ